MRADAIVAYTYNADIYCPGCMRFMAEAASPVGRANDAEDALDGLALYLNINRSDESSYDSGEFPKVCFPGMIEDGDRCGKCGGEL